ncbi:MAG: ABC transporter permease [Planctomycetota bacterium]
MTSAATAELGLSADADEGAASSSAQAPGVLRRALARRGAWVGAAWLAVVAFAGAFAPFIANSHPLRMVMADGTTRYPLWENLSPADVAIPLVLLVIGVTVLLGRWTRSRWRWGGCAAAAALVIAGSIVFVNPPQIVVYAQYRTALADGSAVSATYTVIPFSPSDRFRDKPELRHPLPPDTIHWLGTSRRGADLLSRMIHASRVALAVGFIATGIAMVIGVTLGGLMGYFVGFVDLIGMRLVEVFSAIPVFFLLLTFVAFFPRNLYLMMVIIGCTGWVGYARFVRAEFFKLRAMDFVQAGRACGLPLWSILFRHMLPNAIAPVLVAASFGVPSAILYEATLSFLGLGLVDEPSWGQMLSQATGAGGGFYWWIAMFPGLAIFLTVFGFNLFGEALRDVIDVKS